MEDCLFCMIAEGKIPSKKLYEDDQVVAFYDINPQAKVHVLVVPKKHIQSAAALTEKGIIRDCKYGLKVLSNGNLTKKLTVKAAAFSGSAKTKIEEAGGKAEVV